MRHLVLSILLFVFIFNNFLFAENKINSEAKKNIQKFIFFNKNKIKHLNYPKYRMIVDIDIRKFILFVFLYNKKNNNILLKNGYNRKILNYIFALEKILVSKNLKKYILDAVVYEYYLMKYKFLSKNSHIIFKKNKKIYD